MHSNDSNGSLSLSKHEPAHAMRYTELLKLSEHETSTM